MELVADARVDWRMNIVVDATGHPVDRVKAVEGVLDNVMMAYHDASVVEAVRKSDCLELIHILSSHDA